MPKIEDKLVKILRDKPTVATQAIFWKIPHHSGRTDDIRLKVGRYKKTKTRLDTQDLETLEPKSELTFDEEEFKELIQFLQDSYEPFKQGVKAFIPIDNPFTAANADQIRRLFSLPHKQKLVDFILDQDVIPEELSLALENARRAKAIIELEQMLDQNHKEPKWQKWFEINHWVLGSEFVRVLDERQIDTQNISDFLMEAYDGFLDVIEIKRPEGGLKFWSSSQDHGNYIPSSDLIKSISQASRYIFEVEKEANSIKFLKRVDNIRTVKPRGILIFGRSQDWNAEQREEYRILNSSYHNLSILTYDHVLERAKRMVGKLPKE